MSQESLRRLFSMMGSVGPKDPYYSNVVLLCHMDGTNGGATFTDNSSYARTVTPTNATTNTGTVKYGSASAYFSGTTAQVAGADSADMDIGTGDFTLEFWINFSNTSTSNTHICGWGGDANGIRVAHDGGNWYCYFVGVGNVFGAYALPATGGWHHFAWTRSGTGHTMWIDGASAKTFTSASSHATTTGCVVGHSAEGTSWNSFNGYIDDLRCTKGVARYTGAFTPATEAFPNS